MVIGLAGTGADSPKLTYPGIPSTEPWGTCCTQCRTNPACAERWIVSMSNLEPIPPAPPDEDLDLTLRYALIAMGANDGLWDWDLADDRLHLSPRWKGQLGYNAGDVPSDGNIKEWL